MHFNNTTVRFRNNKPYLLKKTIITLSVIGFLVYMFLSVNWLTFLILFLFVGLPIVFKIRKQPSEGKGFFGKVKNFYKNMYKDYVIDKLPLDFNCTENEITISLHRAELIKNKPSHETFTIKKDDIAGIMFDDTDNDFLIMFQDASVLVSDEETMKQLRTIHQQNSTICFRTETPEECLDLLSKCGYQLEKLSEIEDEEEETEDPELVANQKNESVNNDETSIIDNLKETKTETIKEKAETKTETEMEEQK